MDRKLSFSHSMICVSMSVTPQYCAASRQIAPARESALKVRQNCRGQTGFPVGLPGPWPAGCHCGIAERTFCIIQDREASDVDAALADARIMGALGSTAQFNAALQAGSIIGPDGIPDETEMQLLTSTTLLMWYSPDCLTTRRSMASAALRYSWGDLPRAL